MSRFQRGEPEDRDGAYVVRVADSYGVAFWVAMGRTTGGWRVVWDGNAAGGPGSHSYWPSGDCPPLVEWMLASDCVAAPEAPKAAGAPPAGGGYSEPPRSGAVVAWLAEDPRPFLATWDDSKGQWFTGDGWLLKWLDRMTWAPMPKRPGSTAPGTSDGYSGDGLTYTSTSLNVWRAIKEHRWRRDCDGLTVHPSCFDGSLELADLVPIHGGPWSDWCAGCKTAPEPAPEQHKSAGATWKTSQPPRVECRWRGGSSEGVGSPTESTGASPIGWRFTGSDGHPLWYPGLPRGWEWSPMEDAAEAIRIDHTTWPGAAAPVRVNVHIDGGHPVAYVHPDEHERVKRELVQEREYLNGYIEWALSERDGTTPELTGLEAVKAKMARLESERDDARAGLGTLQEELAAMLDHRDEVLLLRKAEAGWRSWGRRLTRLGPGVTDAGLRARLDALRGPGVHPDLYASMKVESIKRGDRLDAWRERVADLGGPAGFNADTDADLWRRMLHQLARDSTAPVRALLALAVDGKPTHSLERLFDRLDDVLAEALEAVQRARNDAAG